MKPMRKSKVVRKDRKDHTTKKLDLTPKTKAEKRAFEFISRLDRNRSDSKERIYPPVQNSKLKSAVKLMREIKLTSLHWINPVTGHVIGYQRAHNLGVTQDLAIECGILNPKTHRLVGLDRAKQLHIIKDSMFLHKIAA